MQLKTSLTMPRVSLKGRFLDIFLKNCTTTLMDLFRAHCSNRTKYLSHQSQQHQELLSSLPLQYHPGPKVAKVQCSNGKCCFFPTWQGHIKCSGSSGEGGRCRLESTNVTSVPRSPHPLPPIITLKKMLRGTEVAFLLPTQQPQVQISVLPGLFLYCLVCEQREIKLIEC